MKNIEQIDPNFKPAKITAEDVEFYDCRSEFFELHGFYNPYKSERFSKILESLSIHPNLFELKQNDNRLRIFSRNIDGISKAYQILSKL